MKTILNTRLWHTMLCLVFSLPSLLFAQQQQRRIQYFRPYDKGALGVFETSKEDSVPYEGMRVRVGANFTQQYQYLKHSNDADQTLLIPAGNGTLTGRPINELLTIAGGFNLATANLNLDAQVAEGVRVNVIAYLSSRHHSETWVKGGYMQFDKLPFIKSELVDNIMQYLTIKFGHYEINYGDAHYRRSDNGNAIQNPFGEGNIMDAFATEIGGEFIFQKGPILAVFGMTDGTIQGGVTTPTQRGPSIIGKLGFDKRFSDDFRLRITGSVYNVASSPSNTLYSGDRAGSRYYSVITPIATLSGTTYSASTPSNAFTGGRLNPGLTDELTAIMINPFIRFKGFELFGTYETVNGKNANEASKRTFNQYAGELIYRFMQDERMYVGARYNTVSGPLVLNASNITVNRYAFAAGWFMTDSILLKLEYVNQEYKDFPFADFRSGAKFSGLMIEGIIGF